MSNHESNGEHRIAETVAPLAVERAPERALALEPKPAYRLGGVTLETRLGYAEHDHRQNVEFRERTLERAKKALREVKKVKTLRDKRKNVERAFALAERLESAGFMVEGEFYNARPIKVTASGVENSRLKKFLRTEFEAHAKDIADAKEGTILVTLISPKYPLLRVCYVRALTEQDACTIKTERSAYTSLVCTPKE